MVKWVRVPRWHRLDDLRDCICVGTCYCLAYGKFRVDQSSDNQPGGFVEGGVIHTTSPSKSKIFFSPSGVIETILECFDLCIHFRSNSLSANAAPADPARCGRLSLQSRHLRASAVSFVPTLVSRYRARRTISLR